MSINTSKLKNYLTINSLFSAVSGLVMLFFSNQLQIFFGFDQSLVFPVIGANLLIFSAFVWFVSRRHLSSAKLVSLISILDGIWVIASLAVVGLGLFGLTTGGNVIIMLVAVWIGFLGIMQYRHSPD